MGLLFINACVREGSRTDRLARAWLERRAYEGEVTELRLGDETELRPLNADTIAAYNNGVAAHDFSDPLFAYAKQFAAADEVLIAAPLWNYAIPALLHDYLELVCSQGVTFDITADGSYQGLCRAQRLTFVSTAGGFAPEQGDDHAFGYVRTLAERFWFVPTVEHVAAWGLDIVGADVDALLAAALQA